MMMMMMMMMDELLSCHKVQGTARTRKHVEENVKSV